jgi:putative ABC transport system permease protein
VLVSQGLWESRFGADPNLVGRSLVLNGEPHTVVGVVPRNLPTFDADLWVPLALAPYTRGQRGDRAFTVVGRLRGGLTLTQAQAEMQTVARRLERQFPEANAGWGIAVVPLHEHLVGRIRPTVLIVWGAVGIVLLIACANTANLLLARAGARQHEIAVCAALGASRSRLVQRLLAESVLLALLGGAAGLLLALAGTDSFVKLAPAGFPRLRDVRVDLHVLGFTLMISLLTGVMFGIVPALHSSRPELHSSLKEGARTPNAGAGHSGFRNLAVAVQLALAVVVLIAAGLLVRSFSRVVAVDLGFRPESALTMTVSLPDSKYADLHRRAIFYQQLVRRVETLPGVVSTGLVSHLPLAGRQLTADFTIEGRLAPASEGTLSAAYISASRDFFRSLGIPLLRGRLFTDREVMGTAPVVVISQTMARRFWPNGDPLGRQLVVGATLGADPSPREIVGVAGDVRSAGLETEPQPEIYVPYLQNPWPTMTLVARTSGDPMRSADALRKEVLALDPDQPVYNVRPLHQVVADSIVPRRFQMLVISLFAALALVLAAIGVYGVMAYSVRQRTREIGVRLALGARRRDILMVAVGDGMRWAGVGIAGGGALAVVLSRVLAGVLFGVTPTDPVTFAAVLSFTALVALLAGALAARRAAGLDPLVALRHN